MSAERPYTPLTVSCDLCISALEEAAMHMPPRREYTLHVEPRLWTTGCGVLRQIAAVAKDHPFAPYINLRQDDQLGRYEWYITDGDGHAVGSQGPL